MKRLGNIGLLLFFLLGANSVYSQSPDSIFTRILERHFEQATQEKLFIHTDKTFYLTGEILWIKANLVNAQDHKPMDLSQLVYIELFNSKKELVFQTKLDMSKGKGAGSMELPSSLETGNYTFRAYTHWMQNFGPEYYFQKTIRILNPEKGGLASSSGQPPLDVQFFPEGGNLVDGLESTLGFRVVRQDGKGINFQGYIINQKRDTLYRFSPLKFGLGHFSFRPLKNNSYQAFIRIPGNKDVLVPLPEILQEGIVMQVEDSLEKEIKIILQSSQTDTKETYYLACWSRKGLVSSQKFGLENGKAQILLDKTKLPEGISFITLFGSNLNPLAERLLFKQPENRMEFRATGLSETYSKRDHVQWSLEPKNKELMKDLPEISLSVYLDDSLSKDISSTNILSYLYLQSEIKGNIESPGFYLENSPLARKAMNNLLLTQGWRRFKWEEIREKLNTPPKVLPEMTGPIISGRILKLDHSPLKNKIIYLSFPSVLPDFYTGLSDSLGYFQFLIKNLKGPHELILQSFQEDTSYYLTLDNNFSNSLPNAPIENWIPDYRDYHKIQFRNMAIQSQKIFRDLPLPASNNGDKTGVPFFGKPDYHYDLDNYTRFPTLPEVITEYVRYIALSRNNGKYKTRVSLPFFQKVYENDPLYLLDGVPVSSLDTLMKVKANKIKSLDVVTRRYYYGPLISDGILSFHTYQGDLNGYTLDAKALVQEYEGSLPEREFFNPVYSNFEEKENRVPDFRTTLYWNPSLMPDKNSHYLIHFYTSDLRGPYRIELNGINSEGRPVFQEFKFKVLP